MSTYVYIDNGVITMQADEPLEGFVETYKEVVMLSDGTLHFLEDIPKEFEEDKIKLLKNLVVKITNKRMQSFAEARGYDSINSVISYMNSHVQDYKKEAEYANVVRDTMWNAATDIINSIDSSNYTEVDEAWVDKRLPILSW